MQRYTVTLPDIGEGVVEGEVVEWLKSPGEEVGQDEPVVVVMTDKATVELPAPYPGTLAAQHVEAGTLAHKDKPLYDLEVAEELELPEAPSPKKERRPKEKRGAAEKQAGKALATPATRAAAREMGIAINTVTGSGKEGRVTKEDLLQFKERETESESLPLIGIPRLMAERMILSKRHIPHFSYFEEPDALRLVQLRENSKKEAAKEGVSLTYMPFLIRALSLTISRFPKINCSVDMEGERLLLHKQHNIGIAMSSELGLIVPVIKGVQEMTLHAIIRAYDALVKKAREKSLSSEEMKGGTITLSNFGVLSGGRFATPIIQYPEAAILAVGRIQKRPFVKGEQVIARETLPLSWSFDHRAVDGDLAASCSRYFASLLENPGNLL